MVNRKLKEKVLMIVLINYSKEDLDVMSPFWDIITLQHFRVLCLPE
jgi:hypothetical protein